MTSYSIKLLVLLQYILIQSNILFAQEKKNIDSQIQQEIHNNQMIQSDQMIQSNPSLSDTFQNVSDRKKLSPQTVTDSLKNQTFQNSSKNI